MDQGGLKVHPFLSFQQPSRNMWTPILLKNARKYSRLGESSGVIGQAGTMRKDNSREILLNSKGVSRNCDVTVSRAHSY